MLILSRDYMQIRTAEQEYRSELYDSVSGTIACGEKMKPHVTNVLTFYWRHFAYVIFHVI